MTTNSTSSAPTAKSDGKSQPKAEIRDGADGQSSSRTETSKKRKKPTRWWFVLAGTAVMFVLVGLFAPGTIRDYIVYQAELSLAKRNYDEAEDWLDLGLKIAPKDGEAMFLRARVYRKTGRFDESQTALDEARKHEYSRERCRREKWLMEAQSGKMSEAEYNLRDLLDDKFLDSAEVAEAFTNGYILTGRLAQARMFLERWEQDYPDDPQPQLMHGLMARQDGKREEAIEYFRNALSMQPDYLAAKLALADSLNVEREFDEAIELYRECTESRFYRLDALSKLGMCMRRMGDFDEAKVILDEAIELNPDHIHTLIELGRVEVSLQDYESAVEHLGKAVEKEPKDGEARGLYASALRGVGRREEAAEHAEYAEISNRELDRAGDLARAIEGSEGDLAERVEIGQIILAYGKEQDGLRWLYSAIDIDQSYLPAHQVLAEFFTEKSQMDSRWVRNAEVHLQLIEQITNGLPLTDDSQQQTGT